MCLMSLLLILLCVLQILQKYYSIIQVIKKNAFEIDLLKWLFSCWWDASYYWRSVVLSNSCASSLRLFHLDYCYSLYTMGQLAWKQEIAISELLGFVNILGSHEYVCAINVSFFLAYHSTLP